MTYQNTVLALIRKNENFLLVKHRGIEHLSWWLPGGVVEPGEALVEALQRELLEETGLQIEGTPTLAFAVQLFRETANGREEAGFAFHFSCEIATGPFRPQDPDDLVLSAHWIDAKEVLQRLNVHSWYNCETLRHWLFGEIGAGMVYTQIINER
jgi:8-oxo-dGTP diphosphatase